MSNKIENNDISLNSISLEETEKIKSEMLRYRVNGLSYKLTLFALVTSICAAFVGLNSLAYNWSTIVKILMNIAILLSGFLFAEKSKAYSKSACYGLIVLGVICLLRCLWAPQMLFGGNEANFGSVITNGDASAINWLPESPQLRGTLSLICLLASTVLFVGAGIYGLFKAKRLYTYLDSIKQENN